MKRIAVWMAIGLTVCIVVLAFIPFAVDLNKHHDAILKHIKPYVNRQVDFAGIRLTLLSGLGAEIKGLCIVDDPAFSQENFFAAESVQFKVALLPLLKKQIKIRKIILKAPVANVVRTRSGLYNFQNLLVTQPEKEKTKPSLAGALLVNHIEIKNGRITYRDLKPGASKEPFLIDDIDLKAREVSLFRPITFNLSAAVMNQKAQNFSISGTIGPLGLGSGISEAPVELHARLKDLPLAALPIQGFPSGKARFTLDAQGNLADKVAIKTALDITGIPLKTAHSKAQGELACKVASDLLLEYRKEILHIASGSFELGEDRGSFTGGIENLRSAPSWNITVWSESLHPAPLIAAMPMLAKLVPANLTLEGPAQFKITTTGTAETFQILSSANLHAMGITYGSLFSKPNGVPLSLAANASIQKGRIKVPSVTFGLDQITGTGNGQIRTGEGGSRYTFAMETGPVGLESAARYMPIMAGFKPKGTLLVQGTMNGSSGMLAMHVKAVSNALGLTLTQPTQGKMLSGPVNAALADMNLELDATKQAQGLSASGTMQSRQGSMMNIPFRNLTSRFGFASDQFTVRSFDFAVFKGSIQGSASYHLKTRQWAISPQITNVQVGNVLDAFTPFKGVFTGNLTGKGTAQGSAGSSGMNALSAVATMQLTQGEWQNFDLSGHVLNSLVGLPGFSQIVGISPQEIQSYKTTRFDTLSAGIVIDSGLLKVDSLQLTNIRTGKDNDAAAQLKGTLSLTTQALDLKGNLALPKKVSLRLAQKVNALQTMQDDTQRLVLPLKIGGTLQKPVPSVDAHAVQEALAGYYARKAVEKGMQKLQEKTGLPATKEKGKAVEQLIEGLFKR